MTPLLKRLWPASHLRVRRFIVYCAPAPELAPAAEQLLRCISRSYFNTDLEFNTNEAGPSAICVNAVSVSDADKCWERTARNIDVKGNEEYFLARDEAYVAAGDSARRHNGVEVMKRVALDEELAALCEEASWLDADPELRKMVEGTKKEHGL